jgi:hypothetical protein
MHAFGKSFSSGVRASLAANPEHDRAMKEIGFRR